MNLTPEQIQQIAWVAHDANRAFCRSIGINSQAPWLDAPNWQRQATIESVKFYLDHPDAPASSGHEAWCKEKFASGWIWGEPKDDVAKTHPRLVPWAELPRESQAARVLFKNVVASMVFWYAWR